MKRRGCCLIRFTKSIVWLLVLALAVVWFFFYGGRTMLLEYFYPIEYEEFVEKYSKEYELDEFFVYAVIHTESKFDEGAVSEAGAIGLMQIMEETAIECNEKAKFGYNIPEDLMSPEANIRIGCYYLNKLLNTFNGDKELALIAYNGGLGNAYKWLDDDEYADGDGGIDITPYKETNEYVDKVMKSYERYREIY